MRLSSADVAFSQSIATAGTRLSELDKAANGGASFPSLAMTGDTGVSVTLGNAALKTAANAFACIWAISKACRRPRTG